MLVVSQTIINLGHEYDEYPQFVRHLVCLQLGILYPSETSWKEINPRIVV